MTERTWKLENACKDTRGERPTAESCEVVLDNNCTAPPGYPREECPGTRARCFSCGLSVCLSCSTIRLYYGKRRRICANCERYRFEDGEARVLLRMYHRAGYSNMSLGACRVQLNNEKSHRRAAK